MVSIAEEHRRLREAGLEFITRAQWGSRYDYSSSRTVVEPAKQVFVHISETNPSAYNSHAAHVRGIEAIGIARFPNTGTSYNRVILFGVNKPYLGQPISRRGAHTVNNRRLSTCIHWGRQCPGYRGDLTAPSWNNNYVARAYVYGALCGHAFTDSVLDTMARAIAADKRAGLVARDAKIHGHRCVSAKDCPCDQVWERMHELDERVNDYLEDDMPITDADAEKIAEAVWRTDGIVRAPKDSPTRETNPHWHPATFLERIAQAVLYDIRDAVTDPITMPDDKELSPRTTWQWTHVNARRALSELAALRAEGAAREQLIRDLQQCDVQLTDEQVERLVAGAAEAGRQATQQVLDRLAAAGKALSADDETADA